MHLTFFNMFLTHPKKLKNEARFIMDMELQGRGLSRQPIPHDSSLSIMQNTSLVKVFFYQFLLKGAKRLKVSISERMQTPCKVSTTQQQNRLFR